MKYSFILDAPQSENETFIFFLSSCMDGRLKYSLGIKVLPHDYYLQKSKTAAAANAKNIITSIDKLMAQLSLRQSIENTPITKSGLKNELDILLGRVRRPITNSFFDRYNEIIKDRETGREMFKGKRFSSGSVKQYKRTRDLLMRWQVSTGFTLDFQTFDLHTYNSLYAYLTGVLKLSLNSVGAQLKTVKAFMKASHSRGWHTNTFFLDGKFKIPSESTTDIYLTIPELEAMAGLELTGYKQIARDWLLVEAFTGLRISDAKRLNQINIGNNQITISNEKTDEKVVLPINSILAGVLQRNGGFPAVIPEQVINRLIKQVGKDAGLNNTILYTYTKAGQRVDEYLPKWALISNHTGRRSFITNLSREKIPDSMIMKLSGIKKPETLMKYNKLSSNEIADVAAKLDFFK